MHSANPSFLRQAAGLVGTAALIVALAGCATDAPVAKSGNEPGKPSAAVVAEDSDLEAARDAYDLKIAQCLREQGFEVKDPEPGQGIQEESPEIREAQSACVKKLGDPPMPNNTKEDKAEIMNRYLAMAKCLRSLGYEVVEPKKEQAFIMPENVSEEDSAKCLR